MPGPCNSTTKDLRKHKDNMDSLWRRWIGIDSNSEGKKNRNIANRYSNRDGTVLVDRAQYNLLDFAQYKLNLPFDKDYILSKEQIKRLEVEIDEHNKDLRGNFSQILGIVPEGISKQDPTSRRFYLTLNDILNQERVNVGNMENSVAAVTDHMLQAYVDAGKQGKYFNFGINAVKELREIRERAMKADSPAAKGQFELKIKEFLENDKGDFLKQFQDLHLRPHEDYIKDGVTVRGFESIKKDPFFVKDGKSIEYNGSVMNAVKTSRQYLDDMGSVFLNGLGELKNVVDLKLPRNPKRAQSIKDELDSAIKRIRSGMKKGGYWPGVHMQNLVDLKTSLDKMMKQNGSPSVLEAEMIDFQTAVRQLPKPPDSVKAKNPNLNLIWDQDPFHVLNAYGQDAVGFNKMVYAQRALLEAMKSIPKNNNTQFLKGMKKFLVEEYTVFTDGLAGRPEWVNNMTYTVNAFQTARTMGFNVTGAVKNAASAIHYFSSVGLSAHNKIQSDIRNNTDGISDVLNELEKKAGYKFTDTATELFTEGLIKRSDFKKENVKFNPITGKILYEGKPIKSILGDMADWSISKALKFHQITENWQRRWMYRTAFGLKWQQLMKSPQYAAKGSGIEKMSSDPAIKFAENHALWMVNGWAYEYAPHAKAKALRGDGIVVDEVGGQLIVKRPTSKAALGGLGEISFHLMHYPMSLLETHLSALKGMHMSVKAGQWKSDEMMYAMRYAGVYGFTQLASILLNTDLNNMIENETINRFERVHDDIMNADPGKGILSTQDPEIDTPLITELKKESGGKKDTFGLMSELTGPTWGHLKYLGIVSGIINLDESTFNKIVFGNVDYSEDTEDSARYTAYQLSTEYGRWKNKIWPAMRDGRGMDLVRHWLGLYPRSWTKKGHEWLFGTKAERKAEKQELNPNQKAINVLNMLDSGYTADEIRLRHQEG
tara:strand:- start:6701 stop:9520 length:2820 start_codon:yes stop_codon:yes gene_type:complete